MPYVSEVIGNLVDDPARFAFVFERQMCFQDDAKDPDYRKLWVKDLRLLLDRGVAEESTIVIDDSPESWVGFPDNVVPVLKYRGDVADREFGLLLPFLERLGPVNDIRSVSKAEWKQRRHSSSETGADASDPACRESRRDC